MGNKSRQNRIPGYLYALDGLRAVSLIFIVMFHTWQQSWIFYQYRIPGTSHDLFNFVTLQRCGYIAIDSFLVLSGFCMFYPIARDMFGESKFGGWKNYFIKRARRIYPSYIFMLIILLLVPKLSYACNTRSLHDVLRHYIPHLLFIHTWNAQTHGSTISTAWFLGLECQFYVLFPFICIPFRKKPVLTFSAMVLFSLILRLILISYADMNNVVVQSLMPAYIGVFGWGMLTAYFVVYARNNRAAIMQKLKPFMTIISALCLFLAICFIYWMCDSIFPAGENKDNIFRFIYRDIFDALIAGFIFTACFSYGFWEKKIWGNRVFVFLSSISYTVFLWHQNIYIFLKNINFPHSDMNPVMNDRPAMAKMTIICLASSVIIGWLVTEFIETPIVRYGYKGCFNKLASGLHIKSGNKTHNRKH